MAVAEVSLVLKKFLAAMFLQDARPAVGVVRSDYMRVPTRCSVKPMFAPCNMFGQDGLKSIGLSGQLGQHEVKLAGVAG